MTFTLTAVFGAVLIAANAIAAEDETSKRPGGQTARPQAVETLNQAQAGPAENAVSTSDIPGLAEMDAYRAVKEGNRLLRGGKPVTALRAYGRAAELEPDARQIAFGEGLAHYRLKELDKARESFDKAVGPADDSLADDALYSLGTCDHAEALDNLTANPQLATSLLESAMRRYHDVLQRRPDHEAARDANLKAASMWRQLKEQLKQQQQEQQQSCDKNQQQDEKDKQEQEQEQQEQEQQDQERQQEQQARPQDQKEQQEEQQQPQEAEQKQADEQQEQQMQAAEKEEQVSREQAERQLREMMQAHRDRQKMRREQVQRVPVKPVDKDW